MNAIKFIAKWLAIFIGAMLALMITIGIIGHFSVQHDQRQFAAMQKRIDAHHVVSGMTPAQVQQVWGAPDRVTQGEFGGVRVEQWTYDAHPPRYDDGRYVGFREGQAVLINAGKPTP